MAESEMVEKVARKLDEEMHGGKSFGPAPVPDSPGGEVAREHDRRKLLRWARAAIEAMPGWMPIDTAPKDGTVIVLANDYRRVDVGFWEDGDLGDEVGWCSATNHNGYEYGYLNPTHWMPLPAPPSPAGEGR